MSYLDWVRSRMKVSKAAVNRFKAEVISTSANKVSILLCSHVEWKFVHIATLLHEAGADVTVVGNNPYTCKQECVAALQDLGIKVFSTAAHTDEQAEAILAEAADANYHFVFDDGAHVIPRFRRGGTITCCTEFTMSGAEKLRTEPELVKVPVYDLNSSFTKHCIGNEYGTGVSSLSAFQMITNISIPGLRVGIVGYGPVGKSMASIFKGAGAITFVSEINNGLWKKAELDGHYAVSIGEMGRRCELMITCTGKPNVISDDIFQTCRDGLILANVGHFNLEIDREKIAATAKKTRKLTDHICEFEMQDGRILYLLCDGAPLNLSGGKGFPIEIIDLSFAAAINSWSYALKVPKEAGLYIFPKEVDDLTLCDAVALQGDHPLARF